MLHYELSQAQIKRHQQLTLAFDRISRQAETFPESKTNYIALQSLISNIGASTRIENAMLTDVEIEWMDTVIKTAPHLEYARREKFIKNKLAKDKSRSIEEVAGYRNAAQILLSSPDMFAPLSVSKVKGLHREMLKYHAEAGHHAGDFKKMPNTVLEIEHSTGRARNVLKTADPGVITESAMRDLVEWYNKEISENAFTVAIAVEFVFRFLAIHPFQDGNGRISRLLMPMALTAPADAVFRDSLHLCGLDRCIEQTRKKYYLVLQRCSGGVFNPDPSAYHYGYFLDYMFEMLWKSLDNFSYYCAKYDSFQALSATAVKVLDCFKSRPEQPLATRDLLEEIPIPRRTLIYAMTGLLDAGFIQRSGKGAGSRYRLVF
jgi:Fic family protein